MNGNNGGGSRNGVAGPGGPGPGGISSGNANKLKLKIPSIQEEGSEGAEASDTSCPPTAGSTVSEAGSDVEYLVRQKKQLFFSLITIVSRNLAQVSKTDILPWNIVTDPPLTNRSELYPIEGSWRLVSNQVS